MFQDILGGALLAAGAVYAAVILWLTRRDKAEIKQEKGTLPLLAALEVLIYICASIGISDYLLNTLLVKRGKLAEDRLLPGTVVACGIVPGTIIAWYLLRADTVPDGISILVCGLSVSVGSVLGARLVGRFDSKRIKAVMRAALVCSFVILIVRMILSAGVTGSAMTLSPIQLWVAAGLGLLTGVINMFGIPMKPTWTAMFLVMGLSPITTLTLVLVMGALTPLSGGASVLRGGKYYRKLVFCAAVFGSLGAILGTLLAISVPAVVLNILLLIVMMIAIVTMFRDK